MKQRCISAWKILLIAVLALASGAAFVPANAQYRLRGVGQNDSGEIGDGTTTTRLLPVPATGIKTVLSVSAGNAHSLALMSLHSVWTWGANNRGQLGNGTGVLNASTPVQVPGLNDVYAAVCGADHCLVVRENGTVWGWGDDSYGQLGYLGSNGYSNTPIQIQTPGINRVTDIAAGGRHSMALSLDAEVWTWGDNESGQLGNGTGGTFANPTPARVPGLSGVQAISAGGLFSLALKRDGTVWAWGYNGNGQLGDGTSNNAGSPVQVAGLDHVIAISAGDRHSLALKSDGTVWAWGWNDYGQLGDGTIVTRYTPVQVAGLTDVVAVSAGAYHSLALLRNGTVMAWGFNGAGMLGDGDTVSQLEPVRCRRVLTAKGIAAGRTASLFLTREIDPDFDVDGNSDLVWQNTQTGDSVAWYMQGSAFTGSYSYLGQSIPPDWTIVATANFYDNGFRDLVWQNSQTGDVAFWLMNGIIPFWTGYIAHNIPPEWKIVGAADFDRDSYSDLIWQNTQTGDVAVWYMSGPGWTGRWDYLARGIPTEWRIVATADLNMDGSADLIWQNDQTGDVTVWYMNGVQWTGDYDYIAHNLPTAWKIAAILDMNNDANEDLVWRNSETGDVVVWYMNGAQWTGNYDYIARNVPLDWKLARTH